jgi:hypothetical protein
MKTSSILNNPRAFGGPRTVYIDESFFKWFNFQSPEANLCYAALSVPTKYIRALGYFEKDVRLYVTNELAIKHLTPKDHQEIKYHDIALLDINGIEHVGNMISTFLGKVGGSVFGLFVPASNYFNYLVRNDFYDDRGAILTMSDDERNQRLEQCKADLKEKWGQEAFKCGYIKELYKTLTGFVLHYHAKSLDTHFNIVYDSRSPDEDKILNDGLTPFFSLQANVFNGIDKYYDGYRTASSANESGLRVVDWIVGAIRNYFYTNLDLVGANSHFDILSAKMNNGMWEGGMHGPFYADQLPVDVFDKMKKRGKGCLMSHIMDCFAENLLSYYAINGEARHIDVSSGKIFNMAD